MNEKLIQAVKDQIEFDAEEYPEVFDDVCSSGADAGYTGFTYYSDTCQFFNDNKALIRELAKEEADDFGTSQIDLVKGFNCLKGNDWEDEIGRALYGRPEKDDCRVINALAWFALEEVAHYLTDGY